MRSLYQSFGKRLFDSVLACAIGTLSLPFVLATCLLIALEDGSSPLYRQVRIGRGNRDFIILKFRSMVPGSATLTSASAAAVLTVTRVGRYLRRTNIDELPQLWNIIRGDMSFVGPRPALPSQELLLDRRSKTGANNVRPGLTGLAQINAYEGMSEEEKAAWDAQYAMSVSFKADVAILAKTFGYLLKPPPRY